MRPTEVTVRCDGASLLTERCGIMAQGALRVPGVWGGSLVQPAESKRNKCHSACNIGSDSLLMQFGGCLAFCLGRFSAMQQSLHHSGMIQCGLVYETGS